MPSNDPAGSREKTQRECPDCGGEVMLDIVPDPRASGTTHREQYSCLDCGATHGGGQFR